MFDEAPHGAWDGQHGWRLVDTRQRRARYPYTFFVPSRAEIDAIEPGDVVKLEFADALDVTKPTERIWLRFEGRDGLGWFGSLSKTAQNLDGLSAGQIVRFLPQHIASVMECKNDSSEAENWYLARAQVDQRILDRKAEIGRITRRKVWLQSPVGYPRTGWRFHARGFEDTRSQRFVDVAIGLVLNIDDGMLDYLNAPVGASILPDGAGYRLA